MQTLKARVLRGVGAQAYAQMVQFSVRIIEVSAFLLIWNTVRYGEWLLVAAIPSYLTFADGGFATTSAREMTIRLARDDRTGALSVYQSSQALLLAITAVLMGACLGVLYGTDAVASFHVSSVPDVRFALVLLVSYTLLGFQSSLQYGVFSAERKYALGTMFGSTFFLVDLLFSLLGGWYFNCLTGAAAGMLCSRVGLLLTYRVVMPGVAPWCRSGLRYARFDEIRRLALPALGSMAIPIGLAFNLSGSRLLVGAVLGAGVVPLFSAMRTLTRSAQTPTLFIIRIVEPELAIAFGAGDRDTVQMLLRRSCQIATWAGLCVGILMLGAGWALFPVWVHGKFALDVPSFVLLLFAAMLNGVWYTALQVAYATNRAHTIALPFALIYGVACVGLSWVFMHLMGLSGAALGLVVVELAMAFIVVPQALKLSGETAGNLLRAVLTPPSFRQLGLRRSAAKRAG